MRKTGYLAALLFVAACSGATTTTDTEGELGGRYDVSATGVAQSALDSHDGSFVPPAPVSAAWLSMKPRPESPALYLPRGVEAPDLSFYHFGRWGQQYPTTPTKVGIELTGLDWHMGDGIELVAPNVGLSIHDLDTHFPYPAAGATVITGEHMDWSTAGAPLLDSTKGDSLWVAQMTLMTGQGHIAYRVLTHAGVAKNFDLVDGAPAVMNTNLAPVAANRTLNLHWKGAPFVALAHGAGPNAHEGPAPNISVHTLPAELAKNNNFASGGYMYLPSLVDFEPMRADGNYDETVPYGNPFATEHAPWTDFVTVVYPIPVTIPHVGAVHAVFIQAEPVSELANRPLVPAISAVQAVKINGLGADAPRAGVGSTPTISWAAPATGTATNYAVTIRSIVKAGTSYKLVPSGTFNTTSTSITLPAIATEGMESYVLTVTAISAKDRDLTARPFIGSLPYASMDYVTSRITP
jgi:hypothetical protein